MKMSWKVRKENEKLKIKQKKEKYKIVGAGRWRVALWSGRMIEMITSTRLDG